MAYSKQTWVRGEKVASAKLNHMEDGIYENSVTLEHGIEAAVDNWLDEHPEATTTVQDGSITAEKFALTLSNEIRTLSLFEGNSDSEKLYDALVTKSYDGVILGGNIVINSTISLPKMGLRSVKIANATITLNADMFDTSAEYTGMPSFINCTFVGNGNAIFGGSYVVGGYFHDCVFEDCAIINGTSKTLQTAYITDCVIANTTVSLINANRIYDIHLIGVTCEAQAPTLINTYDSTYSTGGTQQLWVSDSLFEDFTNTVFKLTGGNIRIRDCYFESNAGGCLVVAKQSLQNLLTLEISGCKVNTSVTAFTISDFTSSEQVKISIHDNNISSGNASALVSGIVGDNQYSLYNNRKGSGTDKFSTDSLLVYKPSMVSNPSTNTEYFTRYAGGYIQYGALVFVDMVLLANKNIGTSLSSAVTNMPNVLRKCTATLYDLTSGAETTTLLVFSGTTGNIVGSITSGHQYLVRCFYFTNNTVIE